MKLYPISKIEFNHFILNNTNKEDVMTFLADARGVFSLSLVKDSKQNNIILSINKNANQSLSSQSTFPLVYPELYWCDLDYTHCYTLSSKNSLCYPFEFEYTDNIMRKIQYALSNIDATVYFQMLFNKADDKWKDNACYQYESHIRGLANPSDIKLIHKLQLTLSNKFIEWGMTKNENYDIPNFKQKVKQDGFEWCGRLIVTNTDKKAVEQLVDRIRLTLNEIDGENGFYINDTRNKKQFVEEFRFHQYPRIRNRNQILTPLEILPFFACQYEKESVQEEVKVEPVKAEKKNNGDNVNLVELLPTKPRKSVNIDEKDIYDKIGRAFKNLKIFQKKPQFTKLETGATLFKATFKLTDGIKLNKIESEARNIEAESGLEGVFIDKGDSAGTASVTFMREERDVVYLRDIMDTDKFTKISKDMQLPISIGEDATGNMLIFDLAKLVHVLVAGTTGSGKSSLINSIITTLMMTKTPEELRFYLIDPKIVEFTPYQNSSHVEKVITEPEEANELLFKLTEEMDKRYRLMSKYGHNDIIDFNEEYPEMALPRIVSIIDEYADLYLQNKEVELPVTRLGSKSRGAGVHLIVCTQRPKKEILSTNIQANLPTRFILALNKDTDYKTCLDDKVPKLLGMGDGVAQVEGVRNLIRFQAPVISLKKKEIKDVIKNVIDYWADYSGQKIEPPEIKKEDDDLTKIKKVIFETGETRISELQKLMKIRKETVGDLMKQLCDEGWVQKNEGYNKGYSIIIDREEMENKLDL